MLPVVQVDVFNVLVVIGALVVLLTIAVLAALVFVLNSPIRDLPWQELVGYTLWYAGCIVGFIIMAVVVFFLAYGNEPGDVPF